MSNDIIGSLTSLYEDAKAGMFTEQQQHLVLAYGRSLIRRRDARLMALEEQRDEVRIALAMRAPPIFGFISVEEAVEVQKRLAPSLKIGGSCRNSCTLRGEVQKSRYTKFGSPASDRAVVPKGQLMRAD